jgi:hypothetical protein
VYVVSLAVSFCGTSNNWSAPIIHSAEGVCSSREEAEKREGFQHTMPMMLPRTIDHDS